VVGRGSERSSVALRVRYEGSCHVVPRCRAPNPYLPQQQNTIPYAVYKKNSVLRSWRWAKVCPKHVELILEINKTVIVASRWFSVLLYLHWWCTVKHKSSLNVTRMLVFLNTFVTKSRLCRPLWICAVLLQFYCCFNSVLIHFFLMLLIICIGNFEPCFL
jgi:hypothetical protein